MRAAAAPVLACALVAGVAPAAAAYPYDARLTLAPGAERFLKVRFSITGVAVDPPGAVAIDVLPSDEVFVTVPQDAHGAATLLVAGVDRAMAWELCLEADPAGCPPKTDPLAARADCPDLATRREDGGVVWEAKVATPACFASLRRHFARAEVDPGALRLLLEEAGARDLFGTVERAVAADPLTKGLALSWLGPTLILSGPAARETVARALVHLFRAVVGRVSYDDRTVTLPSASGAPRIHSPFVTLPTSAPALVLPTASPPSRAGQRHP